MTKEQTEAIQDFLASEIPKVSRIVFTILNIDTKGNNIYKALNCHILAEYTKFLAEKI